MSQTRTLTVVDFLLERYAEELDQLETARLDYDFAEWWMPEQWNRPQARAEYAAKRQIVERPRSACGAWRPEDERDEWYNGHYPDEHYLGHCDGCSAAEAANADMDWVRKVLALPYADHPDFRPEWKP